MRRNNDTEQDRIERAKRAVRSLSFTSLKLYSVDSSGCYISGTTPSTLKSRALERSRTASLTAMDSLAATLAGHIRRISLLKSVQYDGVDCAIEFYSWWRLTGTIYLHTYSEIVTTGNDHFVLRKNDPLFSCLKSVIAEKIPDGKDRRG